MSEASKYDCRVCHETDPSKFYVNKGHRKCKSCILAENRLKNKGELKKDDDDISRFSSLSSIISRLESLNTEDDETYPMEIKTTWRDSVSTALEEVRTMPDKVGALGLMHDMLTKDIKNIQKDVGYMKHIMGQQLNNEDTTAKEILSIKESVVHLKEENENLSEEVEELKTRLDASENLSKRFIGQIDALTERSDRMEERMILLSRENAEKDDEIRKLQTTCKEIKAWTNTVAPYVSGIRRDLTDLSNYVRNLVFGDDEWSNKLPADESEE